MFLLFYLERPDVLPLGDLGVRKGIAKHFGMRGSGKQGSLCQKKDFDKIVKAVEPFAPYRSLFTYYMWKVADTPDVYNTDGSSKKKAAKKAAAVVTPDKPPLSRKKARP
jgi:DNA-3-methyladenine glycosylase II